MGRYVPIQLDLESQGLAGVFEDLIEQAYAAGFADAVKQEPLPLAQRMSVVDAYEDWRAFGPGLLLPGGRHARYRIVTRRNKERTDG